MGIIIRQYINESYKSITIYLSNLIIPVGLSFYTFQALSYLGDIYYHDEYAERNFVKLGATILFFPTIMAGPIQRYRQFKDKISTSRFDLELAIHGWVLFVLGCFEKIVVANRLSVIFNTVYADLDTYTGPFYLLAAVCFSLYIYSDFSAYSDMAVGIAMILGIDIDRNFQNPYLSESTGEFWKRWHRSLNEWFLDYVYIPLGGSRKGTGRKYLNVIIVFALSGLWHGASWNFILWGLINGLFVIVGQMTSTKKKKVYEDVRIQYDVESMHIVRRIVVFFLITTTWVFFANDIRDSWIIIKGAYSFPLVEIFDKRLLELGGNSIQSILTIVSTLLFIKIQLFRKDPQDCFQLFYRQPKFVQITLLALIIMVCVFQASSSTAFVNTEFVYFNF